MSPTRSSPFWICSPSLACGSAPPPSLGESGMVGGGEGWRWGFGGGGAPWGPTSPPPYLVCVGSEVRRYPSYSRGQFTPHFAGSTSLSLTSTNFKRSEERRVGKE